MVSFQSINNWLVHSLDRNYYSTQKTQLINSRMMEESDANSEITENQPLRASGGVNGGGKSSDYSKEGIIKKGILSKKGRKKIFRPWALRTIVLDERNLLSYYDGKTLKGSISLEGTSTKPVTPDKADGRSFAFEITNISNTSALQSNSLILAAGSQQEADDWIEAIISMTSKHVPAKVSFQYESFENLVRNPHTSQPINVKRLKQIKKKSADGEDEDEDEIPSEED